MNYYELDPGIREDVRRVREAGFETTDSGDGVSKADADALPYAHIACLYKPRLWMTLGWACEDLKKVLGEGWEVQGSYSTADRSYILFASKAIDSE